ncbi:hypothetical protein QJQ58_14735 [Paenibacillus dendritiformis]|uniref:hypothetical protein n=1 Tax=Paenibacillus dendritiformis TaxID=130049 RepID=UPI00248B1479|nr:hypothetical protein [Paenibacillus dendritiformis]WGU97414.1 hypothetical protein QJQ58_14735 [Paenibacillus dendritiformis]
MSDSYSQYPRSSEKTSPNNSGMMGSGMSGSGIKGSEMVDLEMMVRENQDI